MIIPDYRVTDFLTNRDKRLAPSLADIYVKEMLRFMDNCDGFIKLFPLQDQFIATLFHEQQLNPMLKAYQEAKPLLTSYQNVTDMISRKRKDLANLCANGTTAVLATLVNEIRILEEKQKNLQNNFNQKCSNLYPLNIININNNNIQHIH